MATHEVTVTIEYRKAGTRPPLYVAGTFSDPQWEPQLMEWNTDGNDEHIFKKAVGVPPGTSFQYKFRTGSDWWILNEDAPVVMDEAGNRNNLLEAPGLSTADEGSNTSQSTVPDDTASEGLMKAHAATKTSTIPEPVSEATVPNFSRNTVVVANSAVHVSGQEPEHDSRLQEVADSDRTVLCEIKPTVCRGFAGTAAKDVESVADLHVETESEMRAQTEDHHPPSSRRYELGEFTHGDHKAPLFPHECAGMGELDPGNAGSGRRCFSEHVGKEQEVSKGDEVAREFDANFNDPLLEIFPSNRDEIIKTVRKIGTGLGEDHVAFEGVPPSPAASYLWPGSKVDFGDSVDSSPVIANHVIRQRLGPPKSPSQNLRSARSSATSLHSIAEAEEHSGESSATKTPVYVLPKFPASARTESISKDLASEEDEGIAMKTSHGRDRSKNQLKGLGIVMPDLDEPAIEDDVSDESSSAPQPAAPGERVGAENSPLIVVQPADETEASLYGGQESNTEAAVGGNAKSTVIESSNESRSPTQLRQRKIPANLGGFPSSASIRGSEPRIHKKGSWLGAFFHTLLVDWIGAWLARLCGGRRKT